MARTNVPVEVLSRVGFATGVGTVADQPNGHSFDPGGYPLEEFVIRLTNTNGTNRDATIKAGSNPPALSAGQGDLVITVPATTGDMSVAGLESARFIQSSGLVNIDLAASFAGAVRVIRVPR